MLPNRFGLLLTASASAVPAVLSRSLQPFFGPQSAGRTRVRPPRPCTPRCLPSNRLPPLDPPLDEPDEHDEPLLLLPELPPLDEPPLELPPLELPPQLEPPPPPEQLLPPPMSSRRTPPRVLPWGH